MKIEKMKRYTHFKLKHIQLSSNKAKIYIIPPVVLA